MSIIKDGHYKFKGLYSADMEFDKPRWGEAMESRHVYVKLDDTIILFREDPDDGYRSYCVESIVTEVPKEVVFNLEMYPVPCYVSSLEVTRDEDDYSYPQSFRGIAIYADETKKIELAKFGTDNQDDYYPHCVQWMDIPAINRHLAEHHLIGE